MFNTSHFHPMLVHFPIALTMVGALFEVVRFLWSKSKIKLLSGEMLLYFATIMVVFALLSGFFFTSSFSGKPLEVRNLHQLLAILSTVTLSMASLFYLLERYSKQKRKIYYLTGLLFYALSALLISATGYMGGNLVYTYMIGL